ncbi:hypothetical protein [Streptomyces milbemycinicus]|uniref:hypothetical protein n=1 Tax=Streptomyces milbemycinicus TaxID=476552 RepID=UPI0033FFD4AF
MLAGIELRHGDLTAARQLLGDLAETADFTHGPRAAVALAILDAAEAAPPDTTTTVGPASALARCLTCDQDVLADLEALAQGRHLLAGVLAALLGDLLDDGRPGSGAAHWQDRAVQSKDRLAASYTAYLTATNLTMWDNAERVVDALAEACESAPAVLPWPPSGSARRTWPTSTGAVTASPPSRACSTQATARSCPAPQPGCSTPRRRTAGRRKSGTTGRGTADRRPAHRGGSAARLAGGREPDHL